MRITVVASFLLLSACTTQTTTPAAPETAPAEITATDSAPPKPKSWQLSRSNRLKSKRITVAAAGDIMAGTDYPENHLPDDDGASFFAAVTPAIRSADVAFGNLEGVLLDGGEPEKTCKNPKACYLFRSPTRYAKHLKAAGFDVMSLANNHALDFGEAGRDSSMKALRKAGIRHSGREGDYASWTQGGVRYAMIAFSPTRFSWDLIDYQQHLPLVAELDKSHDIVLISFHGGAEGRDGVERLGFGMEYAYGERRGDVVAFAHDMIDAGADLIIGHGPHIPRAIELYNDRLIAYSLGNFATYYGISVAGEKGYAPLLTAVLNGEGQFIEGQIISHIQRRPDGPLPDATQKAWKMIRKLSQLDFPDQAVIYLDDGRFKPKVTD